MTFGHQRHSRRKISPASRSCRCRLWGAFQTQLGHRGTSAKGQKATYAVQQNSTLFDHPSQAPVTARVGAVRESPPWKMRASNAAARSYEKLPLCVESRSYGPAFRNLSPTLALTVRKLKSTALATMPAVAADKVQPKCPWPVL
jgi:hypothetical protein